MKIINTILSNREYFKENTIKDTIILHHTVSKVGKYVKDWFEQDEGKSKVATAYVIDKDGTVRELFNPNDWAYHTGTGNKNNIDKRSIGIEIVNEGPLEKDGDDFLWGKNCLYEGEVYELDDSEWRGFKYFAKYTEEQLIATYELVEYLLSRFPTIKRTVMDSLDYDEKFFTEKGIIAHVNIRKDKTDISPAYPLSALDALLVDFSDIEWRRVQRQNVNIKIEIPSDLPSVEINMGSQEESDSDTAILDEEV